MTVCKRLLLLEDDMVDVEDVLRTLEPTRTRGRNVTFEIEHASSLERGIELLSSGTFDVILLDLGLPDCQGIECLDRLSHEAPEVAVVVLTRQESEQVGFEAVQKGAQDFLTKDQLNDQDLLRALQYAMVRMENAIALRELETVRQESEAAARVQAKLLPVSYPPIPQFEFAADCRPATNVGGDFFDFIPTKNDQHIALMADVSGHGLSSALIMAGLRQVIRTCAQETDDLTTLLKQGNRAVFQDTSDPQFVTLFAIKLRTDCRALQFVGAGHSAYLIRASGEWEELPSTTMVLGIEEKIPPRGGEITAMEPGDVLLIPTDGFAEAFNSAKQMWGAERMLQCAQEHRQAPAQDLMAALYDGVYRHCFPNSPADDTSIIVVKRVAA